MQENDHHAHIVTSRELTQKIQHYQCYGEYDQYHDWSLYYSLQDKAGFLDTMLQQWDNTEPEGQKLIIQFIRTLIGESGEIAVVITDTLAPYAHVPEVSRVVLGSIGSGLFSYALLVSMKNLQVRQEEWLKKISRFTAGKKFIFEKKRTVDLQDLYQKMQELLTSLS